MVPAISPGSARPRASRRGRRPRMSPNEGTGALGRAEPRTLRGRRWLGKKRWSKGLGAGVAAAKLQDLPSSRWLVPLQKDLQPPVRFLQVCCCRPAVRGFQVELLIQLPGRWFCLSGDSLKTSQKLRRKKAERGGEWWRREDEDATSAIAVAIHPVCRFLCFGFRAACCFQ